MKKSEFATPILITIALIISGVQAMSIVKDSLPSDALTQTDVAASSGTEAQPRANEAQARANEAQARTNEAHARANEAQARTNEAQTRTNEASARGNEANDGPSERSILPNEAWPVLRAIAQGGPYEYEKDGTTFQNRENRLPSRPRGYYREFTVSTPRVSHRGARRIVTGGDPPTDYFYTDDHYESFRRFDPATGAPR